MYKPLSSYLGINSSQSKSLTKATMKRNLTSKSLSQSILSEKSVKKQGNGIKLPSAYYNDRRKIYLNQSRALSERSLRYQSKDISFSERKKYTQSNIQKVVQSRAQTQKGLRGQSLSMPNMNKKLAKQRLSDINAKKHTQLTINRTKLIDREKKFLFNDINEKRKQNSNSKKWLSPFRDTNTFKSKFEGKNIVSNKVEGILGNSNPFELKVLNLDRMFRKKDGKLGNIIPLPFAKIQGMSSRSNLMKTIKKKDTIHQVIQQYNRLLRVCKLKKTKPRIGVKGNNFTRPPTLEELMGIKVHQYKAKSERSQQPEEITEQIFKEYNEYYKKHIKQNKHLATRLFAGLKQEGSLNLAALTRFYAIFINRVAPLLEKVKFLVYYFIPFGQQKIELEVLKLILELMCEDLPPIGNLYSSSEFLSKDEKSKIFLQALNRVLFTDLKQYTGNGQVMLNKSVLQMIFQGNEDAVDLLIKLLIKE